MVFISRQRLVFGVFCAGLNLAAAQRCGTADAGRICPGNECCSEHLWCGTSPSHCSSTCNQPFSGPLAPSPCGTSTPSITGTGTTTPTIPPSTVPEIDICGSAQGGVSCPGAGTQGWFYRCCSAAGHCGPKNTIQDQGMYCGTGCQPGYGRCDPAVAAPPDPLPPRGTGAAGETCGPIVNRVCAPGLCCSGSNFCGTTVDFCGAANWCQPAWGRCA